jgi:hypothetical protein
MTATPVVEAELPANQKDDGRLLIAAELAVIREMLGTLESLTIAGQRHAMDKVVGFVGERAQGAATRVSPRNRTTLLDLLAELQKESQRMVPDSASFARHAENLIALLAAVV